MNIAQWLIRAGREYPDLPAIGLGNTQICDYARLATRVARLAGNLSTRLELAPGDRVALVMKNEPAYVETLFGIWHAGCAAVPVNAKLHPDEIGFILENSGARACFVSSDLQTAVEQAAPSNLQHMVTAKSPAYEAMFTGDAVSPAVVAPEDLAWLFYTSGTTGRPKGAMLSHRNLMAMTLNYFVDFDRVMPGDSIIHAAPLSHGSGLWMLPHVCAAAASVMPESAGFGPGEIFELIGSWSGVSMFAAPTMVRRLTLHDGEGDLSNLKLITYGGAPMYVEDCIAALDRFGPRLAQLYGQGESPMTISHLSRDIIAQRDHPDWRIRLASAGVADSCIELAIAGEDGRHLAPGEKGEIICRGDPVMSGYWNNPNATASALRDGWLWTGDIGHLSEDGYLTLTDRSKDLIISGGTNVYPREVEEVLLRHPGIGEVSVIGQPHADWGEEVVAYVVAAAGSTTDAASLDAFCIEHMARFKRPKRYVFIDELPKNAYGKVLKTQLRQRQTG